MNLVPKEVMDRLRMPSLVTLAKWRNLRKGPPFIKCGNRVLYPLDLLEDWERKQLIVCDSGATQP